MGSFVRAKKPVLITPSQPTPHHVLSLSSLDSQPFLRFTIEYLLLYKIPHGLDKDATVARVKSALARALVPYYPLAGRVKARPDGSGLDLVCRAQGAGFLEAVSDCSASEFERAPRFVTQWKKLLSSSSFELFKSVPPVVIQLTWLNDGYAAFGVGFSHCVCDGIGSARFLNLFAELATGRVNKLSEFEPKPVWKRHLLDSTATRTGLGGDHPEFVRVPDISGFGSRFCQDQLSPTSVTFSRKQMNELKKLASVGQPSESESPYTSFEVLSAHVWRSWARAVNLPPRQVLKLLFSINIRDRVEPSLPAGYYGNAFVLGCAQTSARELTGKGIGYGSGLIRRAKERVGDEYVREVVGRVSGTGGLSPDAVGVLIVSQWSRMGLDRVDFGMGRPVHVGPVSCDKYCLILPVQEEDRMDAVKVMVAVPTTSVDRYECLIRNPYS